MDTFSAETFGGKRYALNVCSLTLLFIALTLPLSACLVCLQAVTALLRLAAACLEAAGFAWWDMGQEHAYKRQHGASMIPRAAFLAEFRAHRTKPNRLAELLAERDGRLTHADLCMAGSGREARPSGSASRGRGCDIESYGF